MDSDPESNDDCAADADYIYESDPDNSGSESLVSQYYLLPAHEMGFSMLLFLHGAHLCQTHMESRYSALGKCFKVLTMDVSTNNLDDMFHEAELYVSNPASSGFDLSEDIECHCLAPFPKGGRMTDRENLHQPKSGSIIR